MGDGAELLEFADEVERLLTELRATLEPPAWTRVDTVVRRIVTVYSRGLARMLRAAHASGASQDRLDALVSEDDLLASLLVLHGLLRPAHATRLTSRPST